MFASMEPTLRARILEAVPEPVSGKAPRLTAILYMFDPMRFGVASYRHHRDPNNGSGYLKKVLAGEALFD